MRPCAVRAAGAWRHAILSWREVPSGLTRLSAAVGQMQARTDSLRRQTLDFEQERQRVGPARPPCLPPISHLSHALALVGSISTRHARICLASFASLPAKAGGIAPVSSLPPALPRPTRAPPAPSHADTAADPGQRAVGGDSEPGPCARGCLAAGAPALPPHRLVICARGSRGPLLALASSSRPPSLSRLASRGEPTHGMRAVKLLCALTSVCAA